MIFVIILFAVLHFLIKGTYHTIPILTLFLLQDTSFQSIRKIKFVLFLFLCLFSNF